MEEFFLKRFVDLSAESPYSYFDHICIAIEVHIPDLFGQI